MGGVYSCATAQCTLPYYFVILLKEPHAGRPGVPSRSPVGVQAYKDHDNFNKERFATKLEFTVHHYAGRVIYNTGGFVEKNKDQLQVCACAVYGGCGGEQCS